MGICGIERRSRKPNALGFTGDILGKMLRREEKPRTTLATLESGAEFLLTLATPLSSFPIKDLRGPSCLSRKKEGIHPLQTQHPRSMEAANGRPQGVLANHAWQRRRTKDHSCPCGIIAWQIWLPGYYYRWTMYRYIRLRAIREKLLGS